MMLVLRFSCSPDLLDKMVIRLQELVIPEVNGILAAKGLDMATVAKTPTIRELAKMEDDSASFSDAETYHHVVGELMHIQDQ